jgi:predicted nucleotidyltransferase
MASEKDNAILTARRFVDLLKTHGIDVSEAYIFGSVISNKSDRDSDIDVAVVSKGFSGIPYYDVKKISKYRRLIDLRLEIHPFSFDDISANPPSFLMDIRNNGVRLE